MKRTVLMDGAAGTTLWSYAAEAGIAREPVWKYNMEHPELVLRLHRSFIEAGSRLIQANTFGANGPAVGRASGYRAADVVRAGVELARQAAQGTDVQVALSLGPLTALLEPYGDLGEEACGEIYREVLDAGAAAGADCVLLETFMDVEMLRIAAVQARRHDLPVLCSMTFAGGGKTPMGSSVGQIVDTLTPVGIDAVGMNCSLGPEDALPVMEQFRAATDLPLLCRPSAGNPEVRADGSLRYPFTAEQFAARMAPVLDFVTYVGGCCGCGADHIRALKALL